MYGHYLDGLTICRALGNSQFFIMFTCNVNWLEIKRHMHHYPEVLPEDRADVVVRVFHQKKRGLPHCHALLWIDEKDKIQCAEDIDHYISAELPDPIEDPEGYRIISEMMIYGPCVPPKTTAPCMKENKCSKKFPKRYNDTTYFDKDGRQPAVQILSVHLENMQVVTFRDHQSLEVVANNEESKMKTLIEWFEYNKFNTNGLHLTYLDFPKYFVWYADSKVWSPRHVQVKDQLVGLHMTVNDRVYLTFRAASEALSFLGDDKEWDNALMEACFSKIREPDADDSHNSFWVTVPERYCIPGDNSGLSNLINFIYDKDTLQHPTAQELQHKAIVCPRNDTADIINTEILKMVDGDSIIYKSLDEAVPLGNDRGAT
nr:DNA helicase [Tanacetum cinerariifolium]